MQEKTKIVGQKVNVIEEKPKTVGQKVNVIEEKQIEENVKCMEDLM